MRNKDTLTAAFSLACLEIRSRNEEGINLDCKQSLFSQSSLSWAGLQRAKWQRGKLQSPLSFLFFTFARIARFPHFHDHPEGVLAV